MDEFYLIQKYFNRPGSRHPKVQIGVGDDAAVLAEAPGRSLVVCADTMVSGVHFFSDIAPSHLGYKLAMINLSDLAAMGANPVWATLCLTLPVPDKAWIQSFSNGLYEALDIHGVELVGGDTTKGPLTLTLQMGGEVECGEAITRGGANVGDTVWVSGELGVASYVLALLLERRGGGSIDMSKLKGMQKYLDRPEARVGLGLALSGVASSCIDVSDGLLADAAHICDSSKVGIDLELDCLPLHPGLTQHLQLDKVLNYALTGGDDYELLFTMNSDKQKILFDISAQLNLSLRRIGTVTDTGRVRCFRDGADVSVNYMDNAGFNHFN